MARSGRITKLQSGTPPLCMTCRTLSHPKPSPDMVKQVSAMPECIEAWYPRDRVLLRELQGMVALEKL